MKKQFTLFLIIVTFFVIGAFAFTNQAYAETEVSGNINVDTIWTLANSPYIVTETVQVLEGVILTIEPGVTVKFDDYRLNIRGSISAQGIESNLITFTSNKGNPSAGDWKGIFLDKLSRNNIFEFVNIEYAEGAIIFGTGLVTDNENYALITNSIIKNNNTGISGCRANSEISHNTISNVSTQVDIRSSCNVHNNKIIGGERGYVIAVRVGEGDNININYNNLSVSLEEMRIIDNNSKTNIDATTNWWGSACSKFIDSHIVDYEDNSILGKVFYEPYALAELKYDGTDEFSDPPTCASWTYSEWSDCQPDGTKTRTIVSSSPSGCSGGNPVLTEPCTYVPAPTEVSGNITEDTTWTLANSPYIVTETVQVLEDVTLTIEPGVVVRFNEGIGLNIGGKLIARGTQTNIINFTANQDSNWGGIKFFSSSIDAVFNENGNYESGSIVEYSIIEKAGFYSIATGKRRAVVINNASPFINKNTINNNLYEAVYVMQSLAQITNNIISNNTGGITIIYNSPTIKNNEIFNNDNSGIYFYNGANPIISLNSIYSNNYGISTNLYPSPPDINYNNIFDNNYNVYLSGEIIEEIDMSNNYWGTTDTIVIDSKIWDYYDDISLGKVIYEPFATAELDFDDQMAPILAEVTPVATPTNNNTPNYTFSSNEAGTITYAGGCIGAITDAVVGDNTITFDTLNDGTYDSCTITVTDAVGNESLPLSVSAFIIDTVAPVITLLGENSVKLYIGDSYTDAGATALDDVDGDITADIVITGENVHTYTEGAYLIAYNVSDAAGNPATTVCRAVTVATNPDIVIAQVVIDQITALPTPANLVIGDATAVINARVAYTALTETQKSLVTNLTVLTTAEGQMASLTTATTEVTELETAVAEDLAIEANLIAAESALPLAYSTFASVVAGGAKTDLADRFNVASSTIASAALTFDKDALVENSIKGGNPDLSNITIALTNPLPASGSHSTTIGWSSSNTAVVSSDGQTINRPVYADGDATLTLTATIHRGIQMICNVGGEVGGGGGGSGCGAAVGTTKVFTLTVLKLSAPSSGGGGSGGGGSARDKDVVDDEKDKEKVVETPEGEVLGEMDTRDYKEQEEEREKELKGLKSDKSRLNRIRALIDSLLQIVENENGQKEIILVVLERLERLEEKIEQEIRETEEKLEEIRRKIDLLEQKERAEKMERMIDVLLQSIEGDENKEEAKSALKTILEKIKEMKSRIEEKMRE